MTLELWQDLATRLADIQEQTSKVREGQAQVLTSLDSLVSRHGYLETRVERNTRWINRTAGGMVAIGGFAVFLVTLLHLLH